MKNNIIQEHMYIGLAAIIAAVLTIVSYNQTITFMIYWFLLVIIFAYRKINKKV